MLDDACRAREVLFSYEAYPHLAYLRFFAVSLQEGVGEIVDVNVGIGDVVARKQAEVP